MKIATIATAFALLVIACSSTTTTTTPAEDAGTGTGTGTGKEDAGKGKDAAASSTDKDAEATPETCEDKADQQTCLTCCAADHQEGATVYQTAVDTCICDDANCAADCADTYCAAKPKNPDATCETCFNDKQDSCTQAVTDACTASADCVAFYQCVQTSGCAGKP